MLSKGEPTLKKMKGLVNVIVNINDILLHSKNHFDHKQQLEKLFKRLRNANLKVNLSKCEFGATNVSYLGYRLTPRIFSLELTN